MPPRAMNGGPCPHAWRSVSRFTVLGIALRAPQACLAAVTVGRRRHMVLLCVGLCSEAGLHTRSLALPGA